MVGQGRGRSFEEGTNICGGPDGDHVPDRHIRFRSIHPGYPGQPSFTLEPGDPMRDMHPGTECKLIANAGIVKISTSISAPCLRTPFDGSGELGSVGSEGVPHVQELRGKHVGGAFDICFLLCAASGYDAA